MTHDTPHPQARRYLLALVLTLALTIGLFVRQSIQVTAFVAAPAPTDPPTFHWTATWGASAAPGELSTPASLAVDAAGNVYIADTGNHRIQVFTAAGVFLRTFGRLGRGNGEFYNPHGVAVHGDRVYVADRGNSRVQVFTLNGDFVRQIGGWNGAEHGSLPNAMYVGVEALGQVYVLATGYGRPQRFTADGVFDLSYDQVSCDWAGMAVALTGDLYCLAANYFGASHVLPNGEVQPFGHIHDQPGYLTTPRSVTVAPDGGVWIYDQNDSQIKHYTADGVYLGGFAANSIVALTATGDRLLTLTDTPQVISYDWTGNRLGAWGTAAFATPGSFDHPDHLAAAPDGTFYVLEQSRGRIQHLDGNGSVLAVINAGQLNQGNLYKPEALTVDALNRLYVLGLGFRGYNASRIVRFSADRYETAFDTSFAYYPNPTNSMYLFSNLEAAGDTLLVMSAVGQVVRTDLDGVRINEWSFGWPKVQFADMAIGASGRVYGVNPLDPPAVKAATLVGESQFSWGNFGTDLSPGTLVMPSAVAADLRGRVFVLDTDNRSMPLFAPIFSSRVQVFDESGAYLAGWGSFGRNNGQFANAQAIAALLDGRIVVADTGNNRLQVFAPDGPLPPYTPLSGPTRYDTPLQPLTATWTDHGPAGGIAPDALALPPVMSSDSPIIASTVTGQSTTSADGIHWTRRNGWAPPRLFYAGSRTLVGSNGAQAWRSSDGGITLTELPNPYPGMLRTITASPGYDANGTLFSASYGAGFWRSTDRGDTWQRRGLESAKLQYPAIGINADGTHTILVSEYQKLWRSGDDGLTWVDTGISAEHLIAFSPAFAQDRTIFALQIRGGEAGIRRSTDRGVSWQQVGASELPGAIAWDGLAISPNYPADHTLAAWTRRGSQYGTYLSTDAGETWVGIAPAAYELRFVAFSPAYAQDHRLWRSEAGIGTRFLATTDNGQSWQAAADNWPGATVYGLIDSGSESAWSLWALVSNGLLAVNSTGSDETWVRDFSSLTASQRPRSNSALAAEPGFVEGDGVAVAHDAITFDGGRSWQALSIAWALRDARSSAAAFAPDFDRSQTIAIAWSPPGGSGNSGNGFVLSTDGGSTWQQTWHPIAAPVAVVFDAAWPTNSTLYLGGEGGLAASTDLGQTWQRIGDPVGWLNVTGLVSQLESGRGVLYAATTTHGVWRSMDGGNTWSDFNAGLPNGRTCRLAHTGDLLAVGLCDGGLYFWQKYISAWQRVGSPAQSGINALLLQRREQAITAWVGTAGGLSSYRMTVPPLILAPRVWLPVTSRH